MRTINTFTSEPQAVEVIPVGNRAWVYVREHIQRLPDIEIEGEAQEQWQAVEYSTQVTAKGFTPDADFIARLIAHETEQAAKAVRAQRNALLDATDKEMTVDRVEHLPTETVTAWMDYRQALRDIPMQEGFPFDVVWPERP